MEGKRFAKGLLIQRKEPQALSHWMSEGLAPLCQDYSFDHATVCSMCVCVCALSSDNVEVVCSFSLKQS